MAEINPIKLQKPLKDPAPINTDTLGGIPATTYALKSEIDETDSSFLSGGTVTKEGDNC